MTEFKDQPLAQRLFKAAASAILLISTIYCGFQTYAAATGSRYTGNDRLILTVSLVLTTLACLVMTADAYDFLIRPARRYKLEDVRKLQMIVLIVLGGALSASALVVGAQLFMTLVPAVVIYVLLVVRPTNAEAQEQLKKQRQRTKAQRTANRGRPSAQPAVKRQRRGGRKH